MTKFLIFLHLILVSNLYSFELKCTFEEVYSDGSVQNGFFLIKDKKLRYEYNSENLFTIFHNNERFFMVKNNFYKYYLLKRVQLSSINNIFVATSVENNNQILLDYLSNNFPKIITYKGSEDNVFSRYLDIARKYSLETIIRLTADCPLIDYRIINKMYDNFKSNNLNLDYFSNTTPEEERTYPDGMDVEIFTLKALEKANKLNLTKSELEHVTPCFLNSKYDFKTTYERINIILV